MEQSLGRMQLLNYSCAIKNKLNVERMSPPANMLHR